MALDYAWQTFFSAVREAAASDHPPRQRLEEMYAASIDKLRGNEHLREDIEQRIQRVRDARARIAQLSEREVKQLLQEMVSIYDAISAQLYSTHETKHA